MKIDRHLTRRNLLRFGVVGGAGALASGVLAGCGNETTAPAESAAEAAPAAPAVAPVVAVPAGPAIAVPSFEDGHELASVLFDGQFVGNAPDIVAAADWASMETIRMEMSEFAFAPNDLTFKIGQPYKLELVTIGDVKHEFTAGDFFRSVAFRKAEDEYSEVKVPFFTEIEVFPGKQADIYFIPCQSGAFDLVCEIEGHLEAGMHGHINVEGSTSLVSPSPTMVPFSAGGWVLDGAERVSAANWDTMETVPIEMGEFWFNPDEIHLTVDQPYKLELINVGDVKHECTSEEFFKSVAFRKAENPASELKAPHPREVEVFAGKQTDLYLIPTKAGRYELVCEIEGHLEAGMHGAIVVGEASDHADDDHDHDEEAAAFDDGHEVIAERFAGQFVGNASAIVSATNWDNLETIRLEMSEFAFDPVDLAFKVGQPYKLELVTVGDVKHEFTAGDFFRSVAFRKAEDEFSEVKVPFFTEVEVFPGQQADLYFIPCHAGSYDTVCEIEGHLEAGMHGHIEVTGESSDLALAANMVPFSAGGWVLDGAQRVSDANWDAKEHVELEMGDFWFEPEELHLKVDQPYVLELVNTGDVKHEWTSTGFFATIAFRKAENEASELKAPRPTEVEVFAGKRTELYLIPTEVGEFEMVCEIEGHLEAGMHGHIIVE